MRLNVGKGMGRRRIRGWTEEVDRGLCGKKREKQGLCSEEREDEK